MNLISKKIFLLIFLSITFFFIQSSKNYLFSVTKNELAYKADSLMYDYDKDQLVLYKNAEIKYDDYVLTADSLVYYQNKNEARAYKNPHLQHKEEFIEGDSMKINIEKQEGLVYNAHAKNSDGGIFWGDVIKSKQGKIFYIKNSCYTTCDHDEPHYFFYSKRMKVLAGDKVVAAPVVLYIDEVPSFFLPFAFFSINKNPRSGFLMPEFGVNHNSSTGRYIRDLGYFWLINNYITNTAYYSYEEQGRWELKDTFNYTDRLKTPRLKGDANWQYEHNDYGNGTYVSNWYVKGKHYQKFSSRSDLNANYRYSSSQKILQNSDDLSDKLESQSISSDLIWNYKTDYGTFQTQLYHYKDFEKKYELFHLPYIRFSTSPKTLYESKGIIKKVNFTYSANANNTLYTEDSDSLTTIVTQSSTMTVGLPDIWYFRLNFSSHFSEQWFNKTKDLSEWGRVFYNSGNSLSTSTNIYGYFYPLKALSFRHKITPQVSLSYTPDYVLYGGDFALKKWDEVDLPSYVSKSSENISVDFRMSNIIQTKANFFGKESKNDNFINATFSTKYLPYNKERKWNDLLAYFSLNPNSIQKNEKSFNYSLSGNSNYDFYDKRVEGLTVNNNFGLSTPFALSSGDSLAPGKGTVKLAFRHSYTKNWVNNYDSKNFDMDAVFNVNLSKNWKLSYSINYDLIDKELKRQNLTLYRDLHCWEMQIKWQTSGNTWNYYFQVNIKKIPDVKFKTSKRDSD